MYTHVSSIGHSDGDVTRPSKEIWMLQRTTHVVAGFLSMWFFINACEISPLSFVDGDENSR